VIRDKLPKDSKGYYKKPDNQLIIDAFYRWRAVKTHIANNLGCSRPTLDKWIEEDEELIKAYADAVEADIDHTESKLNELIDGVLVQDYDFTGKPVVYKKPPDIKAINTKLFGTKNGKYSNRVETDNKTALSGKVEFEAVKINVIKPDEC
jgi:hypothetical protein